MDLEKDRAQAVKELEAMLKLEKEKLENVDNRRWMPSEKALSRALYGRRITALHVAIRTLNESLAPKAT